MIKDISVWMKSLIQKLSDAYGRRIVFIGLQGSYARGEATEQSDIDVVFILDELTLNDLATYKDVLRKMPCCEKACGFICGRQELLAWAKSDLFQLVCDTSPYFGDLNNLVGPIDRCYLIEAVKLGTGNLYHEVCHRFVFGGKLTEQVEALKSAYKTVFFILRTCVFIETGQYVRQRGALEEYVSNADKHMLRVYGDWQQMKSDRAERPEYFFELMMNWCRLKLVQSG